MTSENEENQDIIAETNIEPQKRSSKTIIIIVIVIAIIVVSFLAYWSLNEGFLRNQNETQDWYFKGAYANYEGTTSYLFMNVNFSMRLEIVDFNSTHVKMLYDMRMQAGSLGNLFQQQGTQWAPAENIGKFAWEKMGGYVLDSEYEDHVYIEGIGTKLCKIYEFTQNNESGNMNITVYADQKIQWPLKIKFEMNQENNMNISLDINMKDTNITELM